MYNRETFEKTIDDAERALKDVEAAENRASGEILRQAAENYQSLCHAFGYLETFYPGTPLEKRARRLIHFGRRVLYGRRLSAAREKGQSLLKRVPASFALVRAHVLLAALIGLGSAALTAIIVYINPEFGWNFLSEETVGQLRSGHIWTEKIQGMSSLASSQIAVNNIKVSFMAFALGITGGALTVVILIFNGSHLGGIFAALSQYDMAGQLLEFILAHGFLELSVIAVAAGAGLYIGDAIIHPGSKTRKEALQQNARPAIDVVIFSAICLVPAGLTEGYVSPYDFIPLLVKLSIGLALGFLYWSYLLTGRWVPTIHRRGGPVGRPQNVA